MKNKTLATFGIVALILFIMFSATNDAGNNISPVSLMIIGEIAILTYTIMAIIRLWKINRALSILLLVTTLLIAPIMAIPHSHPHGRQIIWITNFARVSGFATYIWSIIQLIITVRPRN